MRRSRSYKFTDKHHSKAGIRSSIAGAFSLLCTAIGLQGAFVTRGNSGNYQAALGFLAIVFCIWGLVAAARCLKEEEVYYVFGKLGFVINLVMLVFWIAVTGMGFLL